MKTQFTKLEIIRRKGCYTENKVLELSFINKKIITWSNIFKSKIPFKDKIYFFYHNIDLSWDEKKNILFDNLIIYKILNKHGFDWL